MRGCKGGRAAEFEAGLVLLFICDMLSNTNAA